MVETVAGLTGAGGLLAGFVYLLVANRHDRRDYREAIAKAEARADAAEERTRAMRDVVETERGLRHAAENIAAVLQAEDAIRRIGTDGTGGLP